MIGPTGVAMGPHLLGNGPPGTEAADVSTESESRLLPLRERGLPDDQEAGLAPMRGAAARNGRSPGSDCGLWASTSSSELQRAPGTGVPRLCTTEG